MMRMTDCNRGRFDGPLYTEGLVWRIELASPHWPD